MTTPAQKAKLTRRHKSELMTLFLRNYESITRKRITIDLIRSPEWREMQARFIELFIPLYAEKGKPHDTQSKVGS
jgi:hypothetical protein